MKGRCLAATVLFLSLTVLLAARADDAQRRLTPADMSELPTIAPGAGTSGIGGIRVTVLSGDPGRPGLYTIRLSVPADTTIAAHTHRDERVATVISGVWYFGYGDRHEPAATRELPAGSYYTEPAGVPHFASTGAQGAVLYITGFGPTDTVYVDAAIDPRR